jgi:N-methylhydantoinase B
MLAMRAYFPLEGAAGGLPGATTELLLHRADGHTERVSTAAAGVELLAGECFEIRCASGGGVGDPLDRDPVLVVADVTAGLFGAAAAKETYGVALRPDGTLDAPATSRRRASDRRRRLRQAVPAAHPLPDDTVATGPQLPLYPGVVERHGLAVAAASGAPLAVAPDHWTDGCPVLETRRPGPGPAVVWRGYLDPRSGRFLHVEVLPAGESRGFEVRPDRDIG